MIKLFIISTLLFLAATRNLQQTQQQSIYDIISQINQLEKNVYDSQNINQNSQSAPSNPDSQVPPPPNYPPIPELSEQDIQLILGVWAVAVFFSLSIASVMICLCVKKLNKRNKVKARMQQLQLFFAQSRNVNVFEMQTHPNFPKTIQI